MDDVRYRLGLMGITDKGIASPIHQSSDMETYEYAKGQTYHLTGEDVAARKALANMVRARGFEQVVEEVAYTWFNRLIAIRFMEVNDYLPHHTRVLSSATPGQKTPDIVTRALDIDLGLTDKEKQQVLELKLSNKTDELFRFLFLKQCQQLSDLLPGLFDEGTEGGGYPLPTTPYSLLLTISYVNPAGIVAELLKIPESYFNVNEVDEDGEPTGQIQIIGWMYQYYIEEKRDQVVNIYKKASVKKDDLPAATQLFTTEWVVKYMVENSLGRVWLESHPNETLATKWKYYMRTEEQPVGAVCAVRSPEELKVFDPCMGSGHILVYAFDLLMDIYLSRGYLAKDAARFIVEQNLYGLDIDKRAAQLTYFAVMMKGRQHDRNFLNRNIRPNVYEIHESNDLDAPGGLPSQLRLSPRTARLARELIDCYRDAKTRGSLIDANPLELSDLDDLQEDLLDESTRNVAMSRWLEDAKKLFPHFVAQTKLLTQQYHAVVTNPPYLNKYDDTLKEFVRAVYKDYSADLFSCFMYRNFDFCMPNGYAAFMTPFVWMFIKSYEKLRGYIIEQKAITSLIQMEYSAFEEATVPICSFILRNGRPLGKGNYLRLSDFRGGMAVQNEKVLEAQADDRCSYRYFADQNNFTKIPGAPVAYWASEALLKAFEVGKRMDSLIDPRQGLATTDNNRFIRQWYEVLYKRITFTINSISEAEDCEGLKWVPYNKGGERRQWYGNYDYVVDWSNNGQEIKDNVLRKYPYLKTPDFVVKNTSFYFREAITWGLITSGGFSIRYRTAGGIHDVSGMSAFTDDHETLLYLLALMSTHLADHVFKMVNPTINLQIGDFNVFPVLEDEGAKPKVNQIAEKSIELAKHDWDSFETSWDFRCHPMVGNHWLIASDQQLVPYDRRSLISEHYSNWKSETLTRFAQLKANEEELNRIFIDIYGLQDELSPEVEDKDVTVYRIIDEPDEEERKMRYVLSKKDAVITLISYAVGCMFGRYSLDEEGLILAGQPFSDKFVFANHQHAGMAEQGGHTPASEIGECYIRLQDGTTKKCSFTPDDDNIIPITDEEYFSDDIVTRFVEWIRAAYGTETLENNLRFVADALGGSGTPRDVIRNYFLKEFYKDHKKTYKNRPIYWLFDSGRRNSFKALIYMHRYDQDTLGRVRVDYLHRLQGLYENAVGSCDSILASSASAAEKSRATKRREKLLRQLEECRIYDQALGHLAGQRIRIDLDDGVKHNYALFQGVELAKDGKRAAKVDLLAGI